MIQVKCVSVFHALRATLFKLPQASQESLLHASRYGPGMWDVNMSSAMTISLKHPLSTTSVSAAGGIHIWSIPLD